jgi:6-phosphogluconolactonase (cycloisomerase 2 family)
VDIIYVLNEVSNSLTVHTLPATGSSKLLSRHTILPPDDQITPNTNPYMTASEIILLPPLTPNSPSLLIASNRFSTSSKGDALALFKVDENGVVERTDEGWFWPGGSHLRGLAGDRSGRWVVVAGRDGGGVILLERVGDGLELAEVARIQISDVVAPLWI